jgi:hypothetical protein
MGIAPLPAAEHPSRIAPNGVLLLRQSLSVESVACDGPRNARVFFHTNLFR